MDIYLTDLETNNRFRFPMLPQKIEVGYGATFYSYNILNIGEVKLPSGQQLDSVYWDGMFPGKARQYAPYIKEWREPKNCHNRILNYKNQRKKLRLLITESPINIDVYIEKYNVTFSGGYGDYNYTLNLSQAKDLKIYTSAARSASGSGSGTTTSIPATERTSPPPSQTYTIVSGDSLWAISQKMIGKGSRYPELYEANKTLIETESKRRGGEKYSIYPGQVLAIPT